MKTRLLFVPLLIAAALGLAACGGGGSGSVPANAVAVVAGTPITKAQFNALLAQANGQAKAAGQTPPKIGTSQYTDLRNRVIAYLVQVAELQQQAPKEGVTVTSKDVNAYIQSIAQLHYGGSMKKLEAAVTKSGLTMAEARSQVTINLLGNKIKTKVTASANVTTAEEQQYYKTNSAQFHTPAETTRSVRHILVKTKSLADKLEQKVNNSNFASLAKKYSIDTGSAQLGGKLTAVKGQLVKPFQDVAFKLKTGQISAPVHSQFGWHIIQALGPVKKTPAKTTPFKKVQSQIQQNLLSQKQSTLWNTWLANLQKEYQGKIEYQTGYAPPATTATPTLPTTTG
ncbi:MAG TPA: peptidylprolyl isomerase [Gaiellaceae bacterium]|nr:peptidylprolyl isomerase [Gaiellaceae bacterium]